MELKQIRYFIAVADSGSFSAGARRAFVTQPTLSAAIAALEAELGVALFERRARGSVLTPEGRRVLEHARNILREAETIRVAGKPAAGGRPLKIGLLPTLPPALVASTLSQVRTLAPEYRWLTEDASLTALERRLANGRYDAILTVLGKPGPGHRQMLLGQDALALAFARTYVPKRPVTPKVLHERPLIVRTHCEHLQAASRILDNWQVRPLVIARTEDDTRALDLVAAGLGACLMPDSFRHEDVVYVRPRGIDFRRRLGLEWIRDARGGHFDLLAQRF
ncbi:MAG: LysR family transcriptional regulator [bacterium]